jgi:hypothetical protein
MDAFESPKSDLSGPDPDDVVPPAISPLVYLGATGLIATGLTVGTMALQLLTVFRLSGWHAPIPYVFVLFALAGLGIGGSLLTARDWAAIGGTVFALFQALVLWVWLIYGLVGGLFSVLGVVAAGIGSLTVLLVPLTIANARAVSEARRALYR